MNFNQENPEKRRRLDEAQEVIRGEVLAIARAYVDVEGLLGELRYSDEYSDAMSALPHSLGCKRFLVQKALEEAFAEVRDEVLDSILPLVRRD